MLVEDIHVEIESFSTLCSGEIHVNEVTISLNGKQFDNLICALKLASLETIDFYNLTQYTLLCVELKEQFDKQLKQIKNEH